MAMGRAGTKPANTCNLNHVPTLGSDELILAQIELLTSIITGISLPKDFVSDMLSSLSN